MITSRINLADLKNDQKKILAKLFTTFSHTNLFSKDDEFVIESENPVTKKIETHQITLSHDIIKRMRHKNNAEYRYEVIDHNHLIGKGGFSSVFAVLCTLANDKHELAIKKNKQRVVKIQTLSDEYLRFLKSETSLSQKAGNLHVKNPAIVKTSEDEYRSYLVMKKLHGTDLYKIITQQSRNQVTLTTHQRLTIIIILLQKIADMHQRGIIHRDLKPDNIMLDLNTKELEIFDFGLSKFAGENDGGDFLGTPGFIAIEAFMDKGTTDKSDIFAAAIIIAMLWYADQPGETMQDIIDYKFENIFNDASIDLNNDEKRQILTTLHKMSRYERDYRYSAVEALACFKDIRENYTNRKIEEMAAKRSQLYKLRNGLFVDNVNRGVSDRIEDDRPLARHSY